MKLIILDRDGVINYDSESFIKSPSEWIPIPGSLEAIARLNQAGYHVVVATNQSGVARGLFDMATLNTIHQKLHVSAQQAGADVDAIFFCPHSANDDCDCRKPKAGMLHSIARRFNASLKGVPNVGDSLRDLQAGYLVGCTPYLVLTGKGQKTLAKGGLPPGTQTYDDLAAVVSHLLKTSDAPEHELSRQTAVPTAPAALARKSATAPAAASGIVAASVSGSAQQIPSAKDGKKKS